MEITRGIIKKAQKIVLYGPEGVGKSTFLSKLPEPVFIDTEGSTSGMDVARLPKPTSWTMLLEEVAYIKSNPALCKTLVIDTIDWAEQMGIEAVCARYGKKGIEDFGYGNGYVYAKEEIGRLLNALQELVDIGINVALSAHAQIRKFEQPDEMGSYDRWELKLGKKTASQTAPLVKEWADMVLFANYETVIITTDAGKNKAQGQKRVMYTEHHACWDAKNRCGLAAKLPFEYESIAHIFDAPSAPESVTAPSFEIISPEEAAEFDAAMVQSVEYGFESVSDAHRQLADLMRERNVTEAEISNVVALKGYYPKGTPVSTFDPAFVGGVLVVAWQKVYEMITECRKMPF